MVPRLSKNNLGLVYGEEDTPPGRAHSRKYQYLCRQGISSDDRSVGLEAPPIDIQQAQQPAGPISGRPVCFQSVNPAKEVLQLETGPSGRGDGCLPPGLDRVGICQSTLGTNTMSSDGGSKTEGQHRLDCPAVESTQYYK